MASATEEPITFEYKCSHMWLVVTILDNASLEHKHCAANFVNLYIIFDLVVPCLGIQFKEIIRGIYTNIFMKMLFRAV